MKNTFESVFEVDETYESNQWLKTRIRTFAFGRNRNGSDILDSSLTNFTKAKSTVGAIPIVAKYNDDTDNLEGHNVTMRKNKNEENEIYHDTDALGFTSPTANFYLEEVNEGTDIEPNYKTYVVIEDVYLWKRFDATKKIMEWFSEGIVPRVSMEIDQVQGRFDKDGYFQIHDFEFTGIAALGTDVEPCFPRAEIQLYTVNEFRQELKDLMTELNADFTQGGKEMPTENEEKVIKDYEKTEVEFEEVEETKTDATEVEEVETTEETQTETTSDTDYVNPDNKSDASNTFEDESPAENTEEDTEKDEEAEQAKTSVEVTEDGINIKAKEITIEESVSEDESAVDYEAKFNETQSDLDALKADYTALQSQLIELQTYKRNREESDLKAKFEGKLSDDEFNQVFTDMKDSELDKVEEKLFAIIGKKNFSIEIPKTNTNVNKLNLNYQKDEQPKPYGGLIELYKDK